MKERQCKHCSRLFKPKTVNSVYHSKECQKLAAKQRYYDKKEKFNGKRICAKDGCRTILSRYNEDDICGSCNEEETVKRLKSWGWSQYRIDQRWFLD